MPKKIPFPTKLKEELPEETQKKIAEIDAAELLAEKPAESPKVESTPEVSPAVQETPTEQPLVEETPEVSPKKEEMPSDYKEENCVTICGTKVELKSTKVMYFRNKTAGAYSYLKTVPLSEFFKFPDEAFKREGYQSADQMLYDFLVAAFDDSTFVRDHYDEMTADDVEQIVRIFGRINHIDEKDSERKNREAQAQAKR